MACSRASSMIAWPSLCLRSLLEPVEDFLLTRLANEYVSSTDSVLVRDISLDGVLDMEVIVEVFDMSSRVLVVCRGLFVRLIVKV